MAGAEKVPIWDLVDESYRFVLSHPRELLRVGWAPLVILFATNVLFSANASSVETANLMTEALHIAANIAVMTIVAATVLVGWHRFVLLGEKAWNRVPIVALGRRELRYLLAWAGLSLLFLVLFVVAWAFILALFFFAMAVIKLVLLMAAAGNAIPLGETRQFVVLEVVAIPVAMLAAAFVAIRLSLVLPAMALDRDRAMRQAWSLSSGCGWRLALASFATLVPVEVVNLGIAFGAWAAQGTGLFYLLALLAAAGHVLLIVVTGTVLSLFSRNLDTPSRLAGVTLDDELETRPSEAPA